MKADRDEANRRLVRANYTAFNHKNVERLLETLHPEIELVGSDVRGRPDPNQVWRGHAEARTYFDAIWNDVGLALVEIDELNSIPEGIVASIHLHGKVRATGQDGSVPAVHAFTIRDGLIARIETFHLDWRQVDRRAD